MWSLDMVILIDTWGEIVIFSQEREKQENLGI